MRLHKGKIFFILYLIFIGGIVFSSTFIFDLFTFKSIKTELRLLYETEFNNCKIVAIKTKQYPSAGYYKIFQVNCSADFYPILLESMTLENESYFVNDATISKAKDDYQIYLMNGNVMHSVSARHIEHERGLGFETRVLIVALIILVFIVQFFIPDHYFDRLKNKNNS